MINSLDTGKIIRYSIKKLIKIKSKIQKTVIMYKSRFRFFRFEFYKELFLAWISYLKMEIPTRKDYLF